MRSCYLLVCIGSFVVSTWAGIPQTHSVNATVVSEAVSEDPDDPAIWVHPTDPSRSLILGTDKTAAPKGGLYAFDLKGKIKQHIANIDRPNNVDVEQLVFGRAKMDVAVLTERLKSRLRVFAIDRETGELQDVSGETDVFQGQTGEANAPMGISLYKRPNDGALFATVSAKESSKTDCLWQYRLDFNPASRKVDIKLVRKFGRFSGKKEIEALATDDELGYLYAADEGAGIHKYYADPDHPNAQKELAFFATNGWRGDHEGIAIYNLPNGKGYVVATDQIKGNSIYRIYKREGEPGSPHTHRLLKEVSGGSDETDGIEVVSANLGSAFPNGLLVAMNSGPKNFLFFDWRSIADSGQTKLNFRTW